MRLTTTLLSALLCADLPAQLVINELMQSNIDCVVDDLNQFPDSWVELYNAGPSALDLADYSLGLTPRADSAWHLPPQAVAPGGYVLIYCDKEAQRLHTDFRLESGRGGSVYLFKGTEVADRLTDLAKQPAPGVAYGRKTDADPTWGYQAKPTPAAANCGSLCTEVLGEPVFSLPGQVTESGTSLSLTLSLPPGAPPGTQIRITYNGAEPTETSPAVSGTILLNASRTVRARLFCPGYLSPRSTTHSYLFLPRQMTLPVVSIVTDSRYFNDGKMGIYVDGTYNASHRNYTYDWRRPINIELYDAPRTRARLNQLCETRVAGAASRGNKLKSLALYAHKRFGTKRFKYEFFPDQRPGVTDYKSVMLRNAGNDFDYLYMRDAIAQGTMAAHADIDYQAWRPAIVYLNGTYLGILNLRERSNEHNIYTNYDGLEDIDMIENWREVKTGDDATFRAFRDFYTEPGHSRDEYEAAMDCGEYVNFMLMHLYYNNVDFPGNNIVQWRPRAEGGRWRWVAKDADYTLGIYGMRADYDIIRWLYEPADDPAIAWANKADDTRLFRRFMEVDELRDLFLDRAAIYMGDFLNYRGTWATWEPMYDLIKTEYPYHRALINRWWPNYADELASAKAWLTQRTDLFYGYLAERYGLGAACPLSVDDALTPSQRRALVVTANDIPITTGLLDGRYWAGRTLRLAATPGGEGQLPEGHGVTGWRIETTHLNGTLTSQTFDGAECTMEMPECRRLRANPIIGPVTADIDAIGADPGDGGAPRYYDTRGIRQPSLRPGYNIVVYPDGTRRKVWMDP